MNENHEEDERPTEDYVERNEDCTPEDLVETDEESVEDNDLEPAKMGSDFEPKNGQGDYPLTVGILWYSTCHGYQAQVHETRL